MDRAAMINVFLRSLTIQLSFNFRTMQGLGFAFSMLPLKSVVRGADGKNNGAFIVKHLRMFHTNPYLAPAIIGSVLKIEEEGDEEGKADDVKKALMGPYAAIGDSFFEGAIRLFSAVFAVLLALCGSILAPLAFMFIFFPPQLLVRMNGFIKGYRLGRDGFNYIGALDLPGVSSRLHYGSLFVIGLLAAWGLNANGEYGSFLQIAFSWLFSAAVFLLSFLGARRQISAERIIYGVALLCMVISF